MIELVGKDIKIIIMIVFHMVMKLSERLHILSGDMEGMFKKKKKDPNQASGDEYYNV